MNQSWWKSFGPLVTKMDPVVPPRYKSFSGTLTLSRTSLIPPVAGLTLGGWELLGQAEGGKEARFKEAQFWPAHPSLLSYGSEMEPDMPGKHVSGRGRGWGGELTLEVQSLKLAPGWSLGWATECQYVFLWYNKQKPIILKLTVQS